MSGASGHERFDRRDEELERLRRLVRDLGFEARGRCRRRDRKERVEGSASVGEERVKGSASMERRPIISFPSTLGPVLGVCRPRLNFPIGATTSECYHGCYEPSIA